MTVRVTHPFVSAIPDGSDTDIVRPSDWNADHTIEGLGTAAEADTTDFATAAQGAKADTALQSSDIGVTVQAHSVVLDATTASFTTADETKLDGIEASADVTDATNVAAAGAVMESDTSTASMSFVIDEDSMASDSATKVPTQQSVKAYVGSSIDALDSGPIVILATGQSNITVTPAYAWEPVPNCVKWDWEYANEADVGTQFLPLDDATINVSWKFASDLARDNPTRTVYLINIAWSAQNISHWMAGASSPDVFQIILNNVPDALTAAGVDHIDMMLWWQGESDAASPSTYIADFETVMTRFKGETWFPVNTPVVVFSINNTANHGSATRDVFNEILQKCVYADSDNRMFTYAPGSLPQSYWTSGSSYNDMTVDGYFIVGGIAYHNWQHGTGRKVVKGLSQNYGTFDFELVGSFYISGSETVPYTTPGGFSIQTKFKFDTGTMVGASQLVCWGIGSGSSSNSRVLSVCDARTVAHQPSIAVFSVNEFDLIGFSWEGNNHNSRAYIKTVGSPIAFKINTTECGGFTTTGDLTVGPGGAALEGIVRADQFVSVQGSDVSLTNNITTAQSVFASANDALTVRATTTYRFKAKLYVATGTTTHTTAFGFGGTATLTSIKYESKLCSGTSGTINTAAESKLDVAAATATVLNATSAAAFTVIELEGIIRVNAAGTLIPQIKFSAGPTGTCAVKVDSFMELWPVGTNTVAKVGNWA